LRTCSKQWYMRTV
jgi:Polypeptide deformylase